MLGLFDVRLHFIEFKPAVHFAWTLILRLLYFNAGSSTGFPLDKKVVSSA